MSEPTAVTAKSPKKASAGAKAKKSTAPSEHPPYKDMIISAITVMKERTGSSRQKILKYIFANYKVKENSNINKHMKKALIKGVTDGTFTKVKGSFKLSEATKTSQKQKKKPAKKKVAAKPKPKKPAAKKATAKKSVVKKAKTPAAKKATGKKASPKKAGAAKKSVVKKTVTKKATKGKAGKASAKVKSKTAKSKAKAKKSPKKTTTKKPSAKGKK